jgi:hypothetical protein
LGEYGFEVAGAIGSVTLPGEADSMVGEAIALAKAPAPVYVSVSVDNRQGTQDATLGEVNAYTVAGKKLTYKSADKYLDSLDTSALSIEDDNKIIAAYNKLNDPVSIGESKTVTVVGTEPLPEDIVRVTIADAYGDETEATKK